MARRRRTIPRFPLMRIDPRVPRSVDWAARHKLAGFYLDDDGVVKPMFRRARDGRLINPSGGVVHK